jgi:DNA-binding NarL/FixJ family response regulator
MISIGVTADPPLSDSPSVNPQRPNVVVITDDATAWQRMRHALDHFGLVVRHASSVEAAMAEIRPDLVILDCHEIDPQRLALTRDVRAREGTQVVMVCQQVTARTAKRALDAGATGLVVAGEVEVALGPTVAGVMAGQVVVPSDYGASLRRQSLSFREKQIVALAVFGLTNSQIGARLFLAESTVKSHLSASFIKLGVGSRTEAAALILDPNEPLGAPILRIGEELREPAAAIG